VRKSLRAGDSESDSKGDSVGGKKLFFQGAHQGGASGVPLERLLADLLTCKSPVLKSPALASSVLSGPV